MPFVLPADPTAGAVAPASWGDDVRNALNFLANPPACRAYHSTTQTATNNAGTQMVFNSERFDTDNMHSTVSNTGRITINTAGLYFVSANVSLAGDNDYTMVWIDIRLSGGTVIARTGFNQAVSNSFPAQGMSFNVSTAWKFAAAEYVDLGVFQINTSAANNVVNGAELSAVWIGTG
jgi:hypothetical protein